MNRMLSISAAVCALALGGVATAQTATQPAAKSAEAKPAVKKPVSQSRKDLKSEAKGLALATEVTENISANQLEIAKRVYVGKADCELNQHVTVASLDNKPGVFRVSFKNASYLMVPEETTTGAVRLEDKKNGIIWIQIPSKSMMMNSKVGQRMVDSCKHAEQRADAGTTNVAKAQ